MESVAHLLSSLWPVSSRLTEYWTVGQLLYLSRTVAAKTAPSLRTRRRLLAAEEKEEGAGRPKRRRSRGRPCSVPASRPSIPEGADERMDSGKRKEGDPGFLKTRFAPT